MEQKTPINWGYSCEYFATYVQYPELYELLFETLVFAREVHAVMEHAVAQIDAASRLSEVEWDFADAVSSAGVHRLHPYPAKFIPQLPANLIRIFHPGDNSSVLDPFCGSGTTLVEAMNAGLPSMGIDLNPLATLVALVKTTSLSKSIGSAIESVSERAHERIETGNIAIPDIPRLSHWFSTEAQKGLAALISEINRLKNTETKNALRVAFSSIIVRVSNQDSDTRYAAIEKNVTTAKVLSNFKKSAKSLAEALQTAEHFEGPSPRILTKDLMTVVPRDIGKNVGLVITSPPYPNAYEYWLYHKYRMYWLGMDPIAVRTAEIGARPHYFKKNHQTEHDFERQMSQCFKLLSQVMEKQAFACFIVGRSIIHGRHIDNEALLERAAHPHGFKKAASIHRNIARNRKSFNLSHGTINREGIVVFARS